MLNIDRAPDADAGPQQFLDVLPAFRVARRGLATEQVGVRQFVHQQDLWVAAQCAVEVEFLTADLTIVNGDGRQPFEALQ